MCKNNNEKRILDKDISGMRVGYLTVQSLSEGFTLDQSTTVIKFDCLCDCGNVKSISRRALTSKSKPTISCGCAGTKTRIKKDKFIGTRVDMLQVINRTTIQRPSGRQEARYECLCDCGNVVMKSIRYLQTNTKVPRSCGCERYSASFVDTVGNRYGNLIVTNERSELINDRLYTVCDYVCDCGVESSAYKSNILKGATTSCGCKKFEVYVSEEEIVGRKYGGLTVINEAPLIITDGGYRQRRFNCHCSYCNESVEISMDGLMNHGRVSCGCINMSRHELLVQGILDSLDVCYEYEARFSDLIGVGGKKLSYDFKFEINGSIYLIECQGQQHYEPIEYFGGMDQFLTQQAHDDMKRNYAVDNGLILIEFPYYLSNENIKRNLKQLIAEKRESKR